MMKLITRLNAACIMIAINSLQKDNGMIIQNNLFSNERRVH